MAEAGWIFDDLTRADIDAAVKAAFTSAAKQAGAGNALVNAFKGSRLELERNGVPLLPMALNRDPTLVGAQVTWTNVVLTTQQTNSFDIDAGTWTARLVSASGRTAKPVSVGKSVGIMKVSDDINSGQTALLFSASFDLPTFGTGGGNGGGGVDPGGTFTAGAPPGSGWTTVHAHTDPPVAVPTGFYGWHRDGDRGTPQYNFAGVRSWDYTSDGDMPVCTWAYIERQRGVYDWTGVDQWIASAPGRFRIFTVGQTPTWATSQSGKPPLIPAFPRGSYPPDDFGNLTNFLNALKAKYPSTVIHAVEWGNEHDTENHTDPAGTASGNGSRFWYGNMYQNVEGARRTFNVFNGDRPVLCGGFNSHPNFELFLRTGNKASSPDVLGADTFNVHTHHSYMYNFDPQVVYSEAAFYRAALQAAATALGKPALATVPMMNTETGHERDGYLATDTDEGTVARNLKQCIGYAVAALCDYNLRGIYLYADKWSGRTFRGPINDSPVMRAAADYANSVTGKVVRQVAIKPGGGNPGVWVRFSDNTEYLA